MGRRTVAILFLVGGLLLLVVVLFFLLQAGGPEDVAPEVTEGTPAPAEDETVAEEAPSTPAALVEVVVSLQTVPRGWQMTEAELTTDLRRAELVGENVITDIDEALGKYARTDIFQGQTLTRNSLIEDPTLAGVEEFGPSSLIPEGYVAQAVPMDRLSSVAYGFAEGDTVDVMITFYISRIDEEFKSLLENSGVFTIETVSEGEEGEAEIERSILVIDPLGRFETLPNGDLALVSPSETQRPIRVSFVLQAARVVQVGPWEPEEAVGIPTATPTPDVEATPTPEAGTVPTATPSPPDVVLLAMTPQQQLVLKYAVEATADIDFALRPPNDTQIYNADTIDLASFLQRFGIEPPIDYGFTANPVLVTVTPTAPETAPEEGQ